MNQVHTEIGQKVEANRDDSLYICRTCLNKIEIGESFMFINDYAKSLYFDNIKISYMIEKSVPELDLEMSDSPIICNTCFNMLWYTYLFKLRCFQTEETIFTYVEKNNLNLGDKIDIRKLRETETNAQETIISSRSLSDVKELIQNVVCITDSESHTDGENDCDPENEEYEEEEDVYNERTHDDVRDLSKTELTNGVSFVGHENQYLCDHEDTQSKPFNTHTEKYHPTKLLRSYRCHTCMYTTFRKRNLRRHEVIHGSKPLVCGICERGFSERYNLKNHMYKHSGKSLPFKCGESGCKAAFARKCDLSIHIVTHMSYNPNICRECNSAFLTREQLEKHKKKYFH